MLAEQINDTITKLTDAFNANDLDRVMTFFSEDAVYEPGNGRSYRGKAKIRAVLQPQFNGAFGAMRFDEHDRAVDAENRKAALRWICRHDVSGSGSGGLAMALQRLGMRLMFGAKCGWQGADIFHFDDACKITGKYSYGWFGARPHLQRKFG